MKLHEKTICFSDLEQETLFRSEGSQITVGSGGTRWPVFPDDLDLEHGLFFHKKEGKLIMGRIDWIEVATKVRTNTEFKV